MLNKIKKDKRGKIAKFEILILIIGIIAFAYSVGQSFGSVDAIGDGSECRNAGGTCEIYCVSGEEDLGHKDCVNDPDSGTPRTCCKDIEEETSESDTKEDSDSGGGFCSEGQWYNPVDYNCLGTKKTDPITQTSCCIGEIEKDPIVDDIESEEISSGGTSGNLEGIEGSSEESGTGEVLNLLKKGTSYGSKGVNLISKIGSGSTPEFTPKFESSQFPSGPSMSAADAQYALDPVTGEPLFEGASETAQLTETAGVTEGTALDVGGEAASEVGGEAASEVASQTFGQVLQTCTSAIGSALLGRTIFMKGLGLLGASGRNLQAMSEAGYVIAGGVAAAALVGTYVLGGATAAASSTAVTTALGGGLAALFGGAGTAVGGFLAGLSATGVGAIIAAAVVVLMAIFYAFTAQNYAQEKFTYQVFTWQAPLGGEKCDECNDLRYGCNEYQCRSYGQSCVLLNPDSENPLCVNNNSDDQSPPTISILEGTLPEEFEYSPFEVGFEDSGVKIKGTQKNDCIPPFTALTFGVQTSEPAKCKISIIRKDNYTSMSKSFMSGDGMNVINHTLYVPSSVTASEKYLEDIGLNTQLPKIKKGDEYNYYIRCQDANGNENPKNFVINFCVADKDLTPPRIVGTEVGNKTFVSYNQTNLVTYVSTNEPAVCKWDRKDVSYEKMSHQMANCASSPAQTIGDSYRCYANFTGINERFENRYYIRCKDNPLASEKDRNVMQSSKVIILKGSNELKISSIDINDRGNNIQIKTSQNNVPVDLKVEVVGGAEDGKARCQYEYGGVYEFNNNGQEGYVHTNTQKINLLQGNYKIPITCFDAAGNIARDFASLTISIDNLMPQITRIYRENNLLKIETNERAECVYSIKTCDYNFENGSIMDSDINGKIHSLSKDSSKTFYIKCKDKYGNRPFPKRCSQIISLFD